MCRIRAMCQLHPFTTRLSWPGEPAVCHDFRFLLAQLTLRQLLIGGRLIMFIENDAASAALARGAA